jgi:hypothetical protein
MLRPGKADNFGDRDLFALMSNSDDLAAWALPQRRHSCNMQPTAVESP